MSAKVKQVADHFSGSELGVLAIASLLLAKDTHCIRRLSGDIAMDTLETENTRRLGRGGSGGCSLEGTEAKLVNDTEGIGPDEVPFGVG